MKLRERMVEATGRVIRERGLAGTTTKEIAHAAGCAEGSIYNHFGGRHELLAAAGKVNPMTGFAMGALAELYREARYSRHALTEAHRQAAVERLTAVHDDLRRVAGVAGVAAELASSPAGPADQPRTSSGGVDP